jgi:methionine sulfoxide reductase heme-binding subunit
MVLASTLSTQGWWITSRAAGIAALVLSSASVGAGLLIGGRLLRGRGPDLRAAHEALSLAALAALVVHAAALLGDTYFHASIADLTIPFVRNYREPFMAIGIIGGWGMLALGLSYYVRGRIGVNRWKLIHRFTALAWILGIAHSLGEGTDAGRLWLILTVAIAAGPPLVLLLLRMARGHGRRAAATA